MSSKRAAVVCAIYVAIPKVVTDQDRNCVRPNLIALSGVCDTHGGGLVGQRHNQIKKSLSHIGRDPYEAGETAARFHPPACLPMLFVNSMAFAY